MSDDDNGTGKAINLMSQDVNTISQFTGNGLTKMVTEPITSIAWTNNSGYLSGVFISTCWC